eukprot:350771-Rhodomonas_salina.1
MKEARRAGEREGGHEARRQREPQTRATLIQRAVVTRVHAIQRPGDVLHAEREAARAAVLGVWRRRRRLPHPPPPLVLPALLPSYALPTHPRYFPTHSVPARCTLTCCPWPGGRPSGSTPCAPSPSTSGAAPSSSTRAVLRCVRVLCPRSIL